MLNSGNQIPQNNIMMQAVGAMMRGETPQSFLQNLAKSNPALQGLDLSNPSQAAGFADVRQGMATLGAQMNECCCSIKTLMLENRLQDTQIALQNAQNQAINAEQSQYLLSQLGKFVANAPATA
jgi:hypothetical protein